MTLRPCLDCGTPTEQSRCPDHRVDARPAKASATERGYDSRWDRLSKRARRLQPFCTDCGTVDDLTGDHLVWPATKLEHVAVVCRSCNSKRGARRSKQPRGDTPTTTPTDPAGEAESPLHTGNRSQVAR